jgi:cobalamin biosynthetic protein CobC
VIAERALADTAWIDATRVRLLRAAHNFDRSIKNAGLEIAGGTSLFRLIRARDARQIFQHLGANGIIARLFRKEPTWLRFGIPSESDRHRVDSVLAAVGQLLRKAAG